MSLRLGALVVIIPTELGLTSVFLYSSEDEFDSLRPVFARSEPMLSSRHRLHISRDGQTIRR
jgi:hypothetical protein